MKIAIPVDQAGMDAPVCPSFGRAPYFLIYDADAGVATYLDNSAMESEGGAGIKAAQVIVDSRAGALLTPRCGENAQAVLSKAGVQIYKSIPGTARENLRAFAAEELALMGQFHAGFHRHGR